MGWQFIRAINSFDDHCEQWDRLNKSQGNHLLLDSLFVRGLVRYFASTQTLLGISESPTFPGIVLVDKSRYGFWKTFTPSQGPLGMIICGTKVDLLEQIYALMRSLPGYALGFSIMHQDPAALGCIHFSPSESIERLDYIQTPRLTLSGTFEQYWNSRGKNLIHNLSRQQRRLAERGSQLKLVSFRHPSEVQACIARYGTIEAAGWKAEGGTAVTPDNPQGQFYRYILETFCARGEGVVYELLMNGETIASDLCLERDGVLVILKTTYDETIEKVSPGLLLHQKIFESLFREGRIKVVEFYGPVRDWHTKWTADVRQMYHQNIYRHRWVSGVRNIIQERRPGGSGRGNGVTPSPCPQDRT